MSEHLYENDRTPPSALEAEQAVLGSMLIEQSAIGKAARILKPSDFYRDAHRVIFEAILGLDGRGYPAELITVQEELRKQEVLENIGGVGYLLQLMNMVPAAANVEYYSRLVEDKSILRGYLDAANQVQAAVHSEYGDVRDVTGKVTDILQASLRDPAGLDELKSFKDTVGEMFETLEDRVGSNEQLPGLSTGIDALDFFLGGLQKQQMVVVAGRSSMGKSALACTIVRNVAVAGKRVLVFSLEVNRVPFAQRLASIQSGVRLRVIQGREQPTDDEWRDIGHASALLHEFPLTIRERPAVTPAYVRREVQSAARGDGVDLVVVDHMHLMRADGREPDNEAVKWGGIARSLFEVGREFNVPMLVLAQMNRDAEKRNDKRPTMADIRGSGGIEENAFAIVGLYRPGYYDRREEADVKESGLKREDAELHILKQRDGSTGIAKCSFFPQIVRFEDIDAYAGDPGPTEPRNRW